MLKDNDHSARRAAVPHGYQRLCTVTGGKGATRILRRANDGELFLQMTWRNRRKHSIFANCKDLRLGIPRLSVARVVSRITQILTENKGVPPIVHPSEETAWRMADVTCLPIPHGA